MMVLTECGMMSIINRLVHSLLGSVCHVIVSLMGCGL